MPRREMHKQAFGEPIIGHKIAESFYPRLDTNSSKDLRKSCKYCCKILPLFKNGQVCNACIKQRKKERRRINIERREKKKSLLPTSQFHSQSRVNQTVISYSNNAVLKNNTSGYFVHQGSHTQAHDVTWERNIYSTDSGRQSDFNINVNESAPHFQPPSEYYRTVRLKPSVDNQPMPPSDHQSNTNYHTSITPSSAFLTGGLKRKLGTEYLSTKRHRPNICFPDSNLPPLNVAASSSPLIYLTGGLKEKRNKEYVTTERPRPIPRPLDSNFPLFNELNTNFWNHFKENSQTEELFLKKMNFRNKLQNIIEKKFPGSELFVFGSSFTGFASRTSDIDICLMFHDLKISKNRVISILRDLRNLLSKFSFINRLQVIQAKVPILKFKDVISGFEVDLNINNPTGIRNSQLLRSYGRIDERVCPLILVTKHWARLHNINDAKTGTLSSYSLGLMLIHYLQYRCYPPVLPPIQVLQPDKYHPEADVRTLRVDEVLPYFRSENTQTLGQLFAGFLHYYSKEYDYINSRISVRLGRLLPRVDKMQTKTAELRNWIDIEEPFEQTNTARSVNKPQTSRYIKSVFDRSCDRISLSKPYTIYDC